jgi:hypothetical protein
MAPATRAATKANRRAVRAWKASRTEACAFFDEHPHRRHALFVARREDYVNLFPGELDSAASPHLLDVGLAPRKSFSETRQRPRRRLSDTLRQGSRALLLGARGLGLSAARPRAVGWWPAVA